MTRPFPEQLTDCVQAVEATLDTLLPAGGLMAEPMRYAAMNGGKRLRAFLVLESAALFDVDRAVALRVAAAIEAVHAYSLVHDDLPCMDDDDLRRGKPTVHVRWDEAMGVLVGDALQAFAFEVLASPATSADAVRRCRLVTTLALAAGGEGMVLGQAQDIAAETAKRGLTLDEITDLQANKTGALIRWSAEAGAILAGQETELLGRYATSIGLAFQIQDDILDVEGDAQAAGKRLQKDAEAGKATFVSLLGLDAAKMRAKMLVDEACEVLAPYGARAAALRSVARFIIERKM